LLIFPFILCFSVTLNFSFSVTFTFTFTLIILLDTNPRIALSLRLPVSAQSGSRNPRWSPLPHGLPGNAGNRNPK
jgi:hypothetical protein